MPPFLRLGLRSGAAFQHIHPQVDLAFGVCRGDLPGLPGGEFVVFLLISPHDTVAAGE